MSSHLSDIKTVSDLIKKNEESNPVESILCDIWELKPGQAKAIITEVLETMITWHDHMADHHAKSGDTPTAFTWHEDMVKLQQSLDIIESIEM